MVSAHRGFEYWTCNKSQLSLPGNLMTSSGAPRGDVVWEGDKLPRVSQHFPKHTTTDAKTQLASQPAANKPNPVVVKHVSFWTEGRSPVLSFRSIPSKHFKGKLVRCVCYPFPSPFHEETLPLGPGNYASPPSTGPCEVADLNKQHFGDTTVPSNKMQNHVFEVQIKLISLKFCIISAISISKIPLPQCLIKWILNLSSFHWGNRRKQRDSCISAQLLFCKLTSTTYE